jgi:hypothetical protein
MAIQCRVVIRPVMSVALSYDHRLVDGREAVQFLVRVRELIEDPEATATAPSLKRQDPPAHVGDQSHQHKLEATDQDHPDLTAGQVKHDRAGHDDHQAGRR